MHVAAWALLILGQAAPATAPPAAMPPVTLLSGAELVSKIKAAPPEAGQTGIYTVRLSAPSDQPVIGLRRTGPGRSELHAKFADVWYVLQGAGTVVTGGSIAGGAETQPGEIRGSGIEGGTSKRVQAGDFGVVPAGVPHWVSAVEGELLYLVVKVPASQ